MEEPEKKILVQQFVDHTLKAMSGEERKQLMLLFEEQDFLTLKSWLYKKWENTPSELTEINEDLNLVLADLITQISTDNSGYHRTFSLHQSPFIKNIQKVAAILFIPIAIFSIYLLLNLRGKNAELSTLKNIAVSGNIQGKTKSIQEYYSPAGTRSKVILRDSTSIWLNSDSKLLVSEDYGGKSRRVKLTGQAYFEVRKNPGSPFIVELTPKMSIKVTGTTFSVGAYEDSKSIETVLISGKVLLNNNGSMIEMKPSQKIAISKFDNSVAVSTVADDSYKVWKDGVLIFNKTPMSEVVSTLEKWFNVKIEVKGKDVQNYIFTANLDNASLTQVLDYLCYSSPILYTIKERTVIIRQK